MALDSTTQSTPYPEARCLYMAMELSATKWRLALSTGGPRIREKSVGAGDGGRLLDEIRAAKKRFGLPDDARVISCYEAGRDGFWIDRLLSQFGIENVVVDAASMKVDRRARRAKTDKIDGRQRSNGSGIAYGWWRSRSGRSRRSSGSSSSRRALLSWRRSSCSRGFGASASTAPGSWSWSSLAGASSRIGEKLEGQPGWWERPMTADRASGSRASARQATHWSGPGWSSWPGCGFDSSHTAS